MQWTCIPQVGSCTGSCRYAAREAQFYWLSRVSGTVCVIQSHKTYSVLHNPLAEVVEGALSKNNVHQWNNGTISAYQLVKKEIFVW